jgi:SOS response regulatory protein OraA/RecX
MAAKKQEINERLSKAFEAVEPKNPALSGADKAYLRGLQRRGFTESEIREVAQKAGFVVPTDLFQKKGKAN